MRVVIAGGTGLIGRALVRALVDGGDSVVVLTRRPERTAGLPDGVEAVGWDGRTLGPWVERLEGADVLVNLAGANIGAGRWTAARKALLRESRLASTGALVEALRRLSARPRVFLQASAVGYYGPCAPEEEVTEDHPPGDDFLGRLAREWEAASAPAEELGVRRVLLRTGVVLSREGGALPRMLLPFRLGLGGRLGSGRQPFPWIHIADEVGAIRFLMEREGARGPYNLTAPNPVSNAEFTRILARVLGRPALIPVPAFALRLAFGEMGDLLLTGQRAVPRRLLEAGYAFRFPDLEAALRDLLGKGARAGLVQ